jgi:lipoic acid synthetase
MARGMTFVPLGSVGSSRRATAERPRLPPWFKVAVHPGPHYQDVRRTVDQLGLHTICEEARCPNLWECWNNRTATFLILGDICTRRCHYCAVTTGRPHPVDPDEPRRIADAVQALDLRHAVITSVNRDELPDGGAAVFAETVTRIRARVPGCTVEVLTPDFEGNVEAIDAVAAVRPDIFNHNIEAVRALFPSVRPQGKYDRSLAVLERAGRRGLQTKSGLIVGMGETTADIHGVMRDLRAVGCSIMTIGQYLQPTREHRPVARFYHPDEFAELKAVALGLGFTHVESGPLVRSSYHAERQAQSG